MNGLELVVRDERADERIDRVCLVEETLEVVETGVELVHGRRDIAAVGAEVHLRPAELTRRAIAAANAGQQHMMHLADQTPRQRELFEELAPAAKRGGVVVDLAPVVDAIGRGRRLGRLELEQQQLLGRGVRPLEARRAERLAGLKRPKQQLGVRKAVANAVEPRQLGAGLRELRPQLAWNVPLAREWLRNECPVGRANGDRQQPSGAPLRESRPVHRR